MKDVCTDAGALRNMKVPRRATKEAKEEVLNILHGWPRVQKQGEEDNPTNDLPQEAGKSIREQEKLAQLDTKCLQIYTVHKI